VPVATKISWRTKYGRQGLLNPLVGTHGCLKPSSARNTVLWKAFQGNSISDMLILYTSTTHVCGFAHAQHSVTGPDTETPTLTCPIISYLAVPRSHARSPLRVSARSQAHAAQRHEKTLLLPPLPLRRLLQEPFALPPCAPLALVPEAHPPFCGDLPTGSSITSTLGLGKKYRPGKSASLVA